jgi:hypothetical protein
MAIFGVGMGTSAASAEKETAKAASVAASL